MEIIEKALSALTETERKIVEEYLRTRAPPKEISKKLGVSVRTVYKALYKYRKILREEGHDVSHLYLVGVRSRSCGNGRQKIAAGSSERQREIDIEWLKEEVKKIVEDYLSSLDGQHDGSKTTKRVLPSDTESVRLLSRIIDLLEEINRNLILLREQITMFSSTSEAVSTKRSSTCLDTQIVESHLPSYAQDNPWLEVLSSRKA